MQGFPLQGNGNKDCAFYNLLSERAVNVPELKAWLEQRNNCLSNTIQNEVVEMLAHTVQHEIISKVTKSTFYGAVADGTTDVGGQNSFLFVLGLYTLTDSCGDTLASEIRDAVLQFGLSVEKLQ